MKAANEVHKGDGACLLPHTNYPSKMAFWANVFIPKQQYLMDEDVWN